LAFRAIFGFHRSCFFRSFSLRMMSDSFTSVM
jgi:hypothetical protein